MPSSYDNYSMLAHLGIKDNDMISSLMRSLSLNNKSMSNDSALFAHVDESKDPWQVRLQ